MRFQEALPLLRKEVRFALLGQEPYLKRHFIEIAKGIHKEYEIFDFFPEDEEEALDVLGSESLFGRQLVILHDFDKMNASKFENMISFMGCLILSLTEKADVKSRAMTSLLSKFKIVDCPKMREYGTDYPMWLVSYVLEHGYTIKDDADQLIYSRVGPDMFSLAHEVDKLFVIKADDKTITKEDVNRYVMDTAVSTSFELLDSMMHKNIKLALERFESYYRVQDTLIELVAFLGLYLEKMYRILLLREEKIEPDAIAEIVGIPRFLVKTKYMSWAQALGKVFIASKLDELCDLDVSLRTFKGDKKILFERYIIGFSR
jgi:DNA polymerase-3 subunit delta